MPHDGLPAGYRLLSLESVDSTNAEALRRAQARETGPLWIRADRQTGGRGRSGRSWSSPPGNLYASLLIRLAVPPERASELSLVAGVALHRTIAMLLPTETAAGRLYLKWPNDLLLDAAKLAGILIESSITPGTPAITAIIGIGINVATHPDDLGRAATHLGLYGVETEPAQLLKRVAAALDLEIKAWLARGFRPIREEWTARAHRLGVEVSVNGKAGRIEGQFAGLAEDGALVIKLPDGSEHRVSYGDVSLI
ncbi:MAG: biotin--[acetyl-CoA-carboxylase] ligase [Hyphomicrobiaceae bacterium]